jgi:hypothetical protein
MIRRYWHFIVIAILAIALYVVYQKLEAERRRNKAQERVANSKLTIVPDTAQNPQSKRTKKS